MKSLYYLFPILGCVVAELPIHFSLSVISANPVYSGVSVNAEGDGWNVGGGTDWYCPFKPPGCASYSNTTTVTIANKSASMWGAGGINQTVYVDLEASYIGYTVPNKDPYIPSGALLQNFNIVEAGSSYELQFQGGNVTSFVACVLYPGGPVYVATNGNVEYYDSWEDIKIAATPVDEPGVYQYGNPHICITPTCPPP